MLQTLQEKHLCQTALAEWALQDQSAPGSCYVGFIAWSVCAHLPVFCFKACPEDFVGFIILSLHIFKPLLRVDYDFI